jgi:hypothetical protein
MAARHKVTVSMDPTNRRLNAAERRAMQMAAVSNQQADLKREAAERAATRALSTNGQAAPAPRTRRSNAR